MSLPRFELQTPVSLAEAGALAGPDSLFVAGGTDLFVRMKRRQCLPKRLISLSRVDELRGMWATDEGGLRIGAGATLAEVEQYAAAHPEWQPVGEVIRLTASPLLRNAGTVGGNLCLETRCYFFNQPPVFRGRWEPCFKQGGGVCHAVRRSTRCHAVYSGDLAGPLLALGATVTLAGRAGTRTLALAELFSGDGLRPCRLHPGEILTEVRIPRPADFFAFCYQKLRLRDTIDFPLAGVSLYLELEGTPQAARCREARVVLNALGPAPEVVQEAAQALRGQTLTDDSLEATGAELGGLLQQSARPVGNTASTARYRKKMLPVLARRGLREALARTILRGG